MNIETKKVIEIIRSTRDFSLPYFGKVEVKAQKSESPGDVVTEIDQQIENYLKAELAKLMPEVMFVGEEFGGDRETSCFWLVDPIDGTGDFIRGIPFCTTMVALIENKQVVFSAIYDFVNDIVYHAELGKGAFMNGEKISVSNRPLRSAYMSFEINTKKTENQALFHSVRSRAGLIQALAAGYEFILVATGKTDGRLNYDAFGKDYDYAPGSLLVSEAGGIVKNFKSDSYDYTNLNFIAANPLVYEELIKSENSIEKLI
jgi:myo-inositol-1(or 4)-monophosphatase